MRIEETNSFIKALMTTKEGGESRKKDDIMR